MRHALLIVCVGLASCGGQGKTPPQPREVVAQPTEEPTASPGGSVLTSADRDLVAELEEDMSNFAAVVKGAGGDCGAIAKAVNRYVDANGESLRSLSRQVDEATPEKKDALDQELQSRLAPRVESIVDTLLSCKDHEGVTRALGRMETL